MKEAEQKRVKEFQERTEKLREDMRELAEELREAFEDRSEKYQKSDKGVIEEGHLTNLESAADTLEDVVGFLVEIV